MPPVFRNFCFHHVDAMSFLSISSWWNDSHFYCAHFWYTYETHFDAHLSFAYELDNFKLHCVNLALPLLLEFDKIFWGLVAIIITHTSLYSVTIFFYMSEKITYPKSNEILISKNIHIPRFLNHCTSCKISAKNTPLVETQFFFVTWSITSFHKPNKGLVLWILLII